MIHFDPVEEPKGFAQCAARGNSWLAENPKGRAPAYWSEFKTQLADGFGDLCAYTAMYEPVGTVDHFVSCEEDRSKAYDWSNYRYAAGWINSSKRSLRSSNILDPLEVENDWFKLILPSLQLVVSESIPAELRDRARFVLRRLHLQDDERVVRQRRKWYELYQRRGINLDELRRFAPLIARAVEEATPSATNSGAA